MVTSAQSVPSEVSDPMSTRPTHIARWTWDVVEAVEVARCSAMVSADASALRELFADDATWIHSSGQVDGANAFIGKIETGASRYLSIGRGDTAVRICSDVALASGIATMTALAGGEPRSLRNRYTNVWTLRDGNAKLVSAQSTKLE